MICAKGDQHRGTIWGCGKQGGLFIYQGGFYKSAAMDSVVSIIQLKIHMISMIAGWATIPSELVSVTSRFYRDLLHVYFGKMDEREAFLFIPSMLT